MYNASKYAVRGFTEALREEMLVAGHPVGVTAVHPGGIKTAIARNAQVDRLAGPGRRRGALRRRLAKMTPERAAEIIVDGILANRPRVLVGGDAKLLDLLVRVTGSGYQRLTTALARWSAT